MRRKVTTLAPILATLLLAGCASTGSDSAIEKLKDDFVSAGGSCADWDPHNDGVLSEESGSCGDDAALSYFGKNTDSYDQFYETAQRLNVPMIVGDNWIIQTEFDDFGEGHKVANELGGTYDKGAYRW